jgi:hypothetical protein
MTKETTRVWEYTVVNLLGSGEALDRQLNRLGEEGWELAYAEPNMVYSTLQNGYVAWFKRPME